MDIAVQIFLITLLISLTIVVAVGAATIIWIMVKDLVDDIRETVRKEQGMSKYIIELEDDIKYLIINSRADNRCYTLVRPVAELEELNSDYINEHYGSLQDEAYQRGLEDAWEAAQKVVCKTTAGGMSLGTLKEIFGVQSPAAIMQSNTAQQAIDKIKTYEDKRSDRIEVGDIVDRYIDGNFDSRGIYLGGNGEIWNCLFWANTLPITLAYPKEQFKKTGKHYDIQSILEAMRE